MRIIAEFEKGDAARHISHLDLMRALQRAIRRAGLRVKYSTGYNPHQLLSFASALSVGITSRAEVMDVQMECEISPELFMSTLSAHMPPDLTLKNAHAVEDSYPALMSLVRFADYDVYITLFCIADKDTLQKKLEELQLQPIIAAKKGKAGIKEVDLREYIVECEVKSAVIDGEITRATIFLRVKNASSGSLNPQLLIPKVLECWQADGQYQCVRTALWGEKDGRPAKLHMLK